jgi:hypothetical protein
MKSFLKNCKFPNTTGLPTCHNCHSFRDIESRLLKNEDVFTDCALFALLYMYFELCYYGDIFNKDVIISQIGNGCAVGLPSHFRLRYIGLASGIEDTGRIDMDSRGQWLVDVHRDQSLFVGMTSTGPLFRSLDEWKAIHIESFIRDLKPPPCAYAPSVDT